MKRKLIFVVLTVVFLMMALTATASALEVNDVAGEFICNCGCNQMLTTCEMQCGKDLRATIGDQIKKGLGKDQIIRYMKVNYSAALLAAPEKSGFNWLAWITPFAVVIIGGIAMEQMIRKWSGRRGKDDDGDAGADPDAGDGHSVDKKYSDRVQKELKEFGW